MPLDAICLTAVVEELKKTLVGGKVDKIYQPTRDEVVLAVRGSRGNVRLLLSANPSHPRAQLTQLPRENPDAPPMFCMLLRKHLTGARILDVAQPPLERVVELRLEALNELGDRVERRLVLEAISRRSNLVLLDGEGRILDCIRHVDSGLAEHGGMTRILQPGMFYHLPPAQAKQDPTTLDRAGLKRLLEAAPEEAQADKWLLDTFGGMSPLVCRELAHRAGGATDVRLNVLGEAGRERLLDQLETLLSGIRENHFTPTILNKDGKPSDFTFFPVEQYGTLVQSIPFPTFSQLLDQFYEQRENLERVKT